MEKSSFLLKPFNLGIAIFLIGFIVNNIISFFNLNSYDVGFIIGAYIVGYYYSSKSDKEMPKAVRLKSAGFFAGIYLLVSLIFLASASFLAKSAIMFTSGGGLLAILTVIILILIISAVVYFILGYAARSCEKPKNKGVKVIKN